MWGFVDQFTKRTGCCLLQGDGETGGLPVKNMNIFLVIFQEYLNFLARFENSV